MNQNKLTVEQATKIIESRGLIAQPGKYSAKVNNVTPYQREDGTVVAIVNLGAMTPYHLQNAKAALKAGAIDEACNNNLSASQRIGKDYVPAKGETVDILVDNVTLKSGEQALMVTGLTPMQRSFAGKVSLSEVAAEAPETAANLAS